MRKQALKRLLTYTKPHRIYLILSLVSAALSVALTLTGPVLIGKTVDLMVTGSVDFSAVLRCLLWLGCVMLGTAMLQWLTAYFNNMISYRTVKDLRIRLFEKLGKVPLRYLDQNAHGDLINRVVNDIDLVSDGLLQAFTQLFTGVATIVGTLIFMLCVSPLITLVVVLLTPLSMFVAAFIAKGSHRHFSRQTRTQGALSGYLEEIIGEQTIVKGFCYEVRAQRDFEAINEELRECGTKAHFYSALANPCTRFVNGVVYASVGVLGALFAMGGAITVGAITMFLTYAQQYTKPFNEISGIVTQLQSAIASAERVFAVLDEPEEPEVQSDGQTVSCAGEVSLREVAFSYNEKQPLMERFNLLVKPGNRIAIVGPTGCGKTTLINLLMRFYDVNRGSIAVDGKDIRQMERRDLRRKFGMVLQDSWLFSGTVRDNIAYGKPDASLEEVTAAAKDSFAHGFIRKLPKGYDTLISENGGNLSQGQKQLLCIARVMLLNPPILILDEATSNIDTRTEIRVQRAFERMMRGKTSFVVAHRLSTIREADMILVMDRGKIVEQGSHAALLAQNGRYAQLYRAMI